MKRYLEFFVTATALIIAVLAITSFFRLVEKSQVQQANLERNFKETDSTIVVDVQQRLKAYLSTLSEDNPIVKRFGRFVAIKGTGYDRSGDPLENRPIILNRQIKFQDATVPCVIKVTAHGPVKISVEMPLGESSDARKQGQSDPPRLVITVTHPLYSINASVFQDTADTEDSLTEIFEGFVQGVYAQDQQQLTAVRQWYDSQQGGESIEAFVSLALAHPDEAVRLQAVKFLSTPREGGRIHFSDSMLNELLIAVEDQSQPVAVRRQLVFAILQGYEKDRAGLYELLRRSGDKGLFAVEPIAKFILDRSQRHWRQGGEFDAPTGAVELLQVWGQDAEDAVPALIVVLNEHPNQSTFAPAAARALGAMGPKASDAIDALELATTTQHGDLRKAAAAALEQISVSSDSRFGKPLQFASATDREHFYPLPANRMYSWLSADQDSLMILRTDGTDGATSSLYKVDLETVECHHLIDLDGTGIQSVVGVGDHFIALRLGDANGKKTLFADTWSMTRLKRIQITTLAFLRPVKPNQKTVINHIVWNDDRTKVAFVQAVRTPRDRGYTESRQLQVKSLDQPSPDPDDRLDEYLMVPIGFSSKQNALYLEGWCFKEKVNGIAAMNLDTRVVSLISPDIKSLTTFSRHRGDYDWIVVGQQSSRSGSIIKLFEPSSKSIRNFALQQELAYMADPWETAVSFGSSGQRMAVATRNGVDVFDTETRQRVERRDLARTDSPLKLSPLVFAADSGGFVLATVEGIPHLDPSTEKDLHLIRISVDQ